MISLLSSFFIALAVAQVAVPPLKARVTDLTGTLTQQQAAALEQTLAEFEARKGTQIAVLMVPTVKPEAIEQFGIRVGEAWKIGRKKVDDGLILVVAKEDRQLRFEVGYGLEGVLPDAIAKRIIDEDIVPRFRQGDFYGGVRAGVDRAMRLIEGEKLPAPPAPARRQPSGGAAFENLIPLLFFVLIGGGILRAIFGRFIGSGIAGGVAGFAAWWLAGSLIVALIVGLAGFLLLLAGVGFGSPGRRSGYGGFGGGGFGGGGWSGGGGGGGFGGGGGGFGGGGASGRW